MRSVGMRSRNWAKLWAWRTMAPWVWTAPLGAAVLPEVYTTANSSAGATWASAAASSSSLTASPAASRSLMGLAHGRSACPQDHTERR